MPWWIEITHDNGYRSLSGPHEDQIAAQAAIAALEEGTPGEEYEADEQEPERFPRPFANRLTKNGYEEVWTDGYTRLLT